MKEDYHNQAKELSLLTMKKDLTMMLSLVEGYSIVKELTMKKDYHKQEKELSLFSCVKEEKGIYR